MKVSGMTRLNTAEYKCILIVVFLNFNVLLLLLIIVNFGKHSTIYNTSAHKLQIGEIFKSLHIMKYILSLEGYSSNSFQLT